MKNGEVSLSDYDDVERIDQLLAGVEWSGYKNKKILITGSNGMLGKCLTKLFIRAYVNEFLSFQSLTLASRQWKLQEQFTDDRIHYVTNEEIQENSHSYDVIFHLASPSNISKIESLEETLSVNYLPWVHLGSVSNLIFISSGEVYLGGDTSLEPRIQDFNPSNSRGIYPYSKFKAEEHFSAMAEGLGIELTIVRLFHTFGPGLDLRDGRSFADFIWRAISQDKIVLNSTGEQIRSFLYILDACLGIFHAAAQQGARKVYNLGSPDPVSILEFAKAVASYTEVNLDFSNAILPSSPFEKIVPNIENLSNSGWTPQYDMHFAIERTIKWARATLKN